MSLPLSFGPEQFEAQFAGARDVMHDYISGLFLSYAEQTALVTNGASLLNECSSRLRTVFHGATQTGLQFIPRFIDTEWPGSIPITNQSREGLFDGTWQHLNVYTVQRSIMHVVNRTLRDNMRTEVKPKAIPEAVVIVVINRDNNILVGRRVNDETMISGMLTIPSGHIDAIDSVGGYSRHRGLAHNPGPTAAVLGATHRELIEEIPCIRGLHLNVNIIGPVLDLNTGGYLVYGVKVKTWPGMDNEIRPDSNEWENDMVWLNPQDLIAHPNVPNTVKLFVSVANNQNNYWN